MKKLPNELLLKIVENVPIEYRADVAGASQRTADVVARLRENSKHNTARRQAHFDKTTALVEWLEYNCYDEFMEHHDFDIIANESIDKLIAVLREPLSEELLPRSGKGGHLKYLGDRTVGGSDSGIHHSIMGDFKSGAIEPTTFDAAGDLEHLTLGNIFYECIQRKRVHELVDAMCTKITIAIPGYSHGTAFATPRSGMNETPQNFELRLLITTEALYNICCCENISATDINEHSKVLCYNKFGQRTRQWAIAVQNTAKNKGPANTWELLPSPPIFRALANAVMHLILYYPQNPPLLRAAFIDNCLPLQQCP